jgi:hypothetical protein
MMADSTTAVYAVVDKSRKQIKKNSTSENEPLPKKSETLDSNYSMVTLDNMYSTEKNEREAEATTQETHAKMVDGSGRKTLACIFINMGFLAAITLICLAILFAEVSKLKEQNTFAEQSIPNQLIESNLSSIRVQQQEIDVEISHISNTVIKLLQTQQANSEAIVQILQLNSSFNELPLGYTQVSPVSSCAALYNDLWSSPSGYYWVRASDCSAVRVYCDMTRSCGGITGGWMRVAELDMTNSSHQCPSGFRQRTNSNRNTCVRTSESNGCHQVTISTHNVSYSKTCGQIIAYQVGSTDAFYRTPALSNATIDNSYVDGISLTHGNSPRQHIWTFAAGANEQQLQGPFTCPCVNGSLATPPSFVGEDYFCETGHNSIHLPRSGIFYPDPLWDGAGCSVQSACCSFNTPPWFYKQLPQPTTDDIEMRVCTDELRSSEDIAIEIINIYIQ